MTADAAVDSASLDVGQPCPERSRMGNPPSTFCLLLSAFLRRSACPCKPDSYCNPNTQNQREDRDALFASPWGGCKTGNEAR